MSQSIFSASVARSRPPEPVNAGCLHVRAAAGPASSSTPTDATSASGALTAARLRKALTMQDELKSCPFCGGDAEMDTRQGYTNYFNGRPETGIAIYCRACGVQQMICRGDVPDVEPEHVISLWNARVPSPGLGGRGIQQQEQEDSSSCTVSAARGPSDLMGSSGPSPAGKGT